MKQRPQKIQKTTPFLLDINHLPNEILDMLFRFLNGQLVPLLFVSKKIHQIVKGLFPLVLKEQKLLHMIAACNGHLSLLKWSIDYLGYPIVPEIINCAIYKNRLEVVQWAREKGCPYPGEISWLTAHFGNATTFLWIMNDGCPYDQETDYVAGWRGDFEVIQWILQVRGPLNKEELCCGIIESKNMDILKWAFSHGCEWSDLIIIKIVVFGCLDFLQWASSNGYEFDKCTVILSAIIHDQLHILKWMKEMGYCEWDLRESNTALECEHLHILNWAIENGFPHNQIHINALQNNAAISPNI